MNAKLVLPKLRKQGNDGETAVYEGTAEITVNGNGDLTSVELKDDFKALPRKK